MIRFLQVLGWVLMLSPAVATAQDMLPLENLMDDASSPYTPTRCAALYQAVMEWSGEQQAGDDLWRHLSESREQMVVVAAFIMQDNLRGLMDEAVAVVGRDIRNITDIYLERMQINYATSGQAFNADPLMRSDLSVCNLFASMLQGEQ